MLIIILEYSISICLEIQLETIMCFFIFKLWSILKITHIIYHTKHVKVNTNYYQSTKLDIVSTNMKHTVNQIVFCLFAEWGTIWWFCSCLQKPSTFWTLLARCSCWTRCSVCASTGTVSTWCRIWWLTTTGQSPSSCPFQESPCVISTWGALVTSTRTPCSVYCQSTFTTRRSTCSSGSGWCLSPLSPAWAALSGCSGSWFTGTAWSSYRTTWAMVTAMGTAWFPRGIRNWAIPSWTITCVRTAPSCSGSSPTTPTTSPPQRWRAHCGTSGKPWWWIGGGRRRIPQHLTPQLHLQSQIGTRRLTHCLIKLLQ